MLSEFYTLSKAQSDTKESVRMKCQGNKVILSRDLTRQLVGYHILSPPIICSLYRHESQWKHFRDYSAAGHKATVL